MVSLVVKIRAREGCEEQLIKALAENAAASRNEPGCLRWDYGRQEENRSDFLIFELYRDPEALAAHHASDHVARWRQTTPDLIESKQVERYQMLDW